MVVRENMECVDLNLHDYNNMILAGTRRFADGIEGMCNQWCLP